MAVTALRKVVDNILEIISFESWVRFYYIKDEDGQLSVHIPDDVLETLKEKHADLAGLAEMMNDHPIDPKASHENICSYVGSRIEAVCQDPSLVARAFDHRHFKIESYLFNMWVSSHEQLLDSEPQDYSGWKKMLDDWRQSDEVKAYVAELTARKQGQTSGKVH